MRRWCGSRSSPARRRRSGRCGRGGWRDASRERELSALWNVGLRLPAPTSLAPRSLMRRRSWIGSLLLCASVLPVQSVAAQGRVAPRTRTYFIAADTVSWDYVPGGRNEIAGTAYVDTAFYTTGPVVKSTMYHKVLYREYTDSTFATLKPRPPEWAHLGFLGPLIRGVVGDTLRIVFRNNSDHPYSMHPHGVIYDKNSEGALYADGTSGGDKADDGVPPGGTHVYVWRVPERAGPGPHDGSSVMWMYHSHVDETRDVNTGLLGVMIITARGMARADGSPKDVDREIITSFTQVHEEDSWLNDENKLPPGVGPAAPVPNLAERQNFYPYFVKFSINGFVHG